MMNFEDIQKLVLEHISLIEIDRDAIIDARSRAARFLIIQAKLNDHLKILEDIKVNASTEEKAVYAQSLMQQSGKNVTENKIYVEADPLYAKTREVLERIDAELNWTKKHHEIFGNAHVMFRQISAQAGG